MSGSIITLKQIGHGRWRLFAPKGHYISQEFRGDHYEAKRWAENWVTSFHNWTVKIEENEDEKKD